MAGKFHSTKPSGVTIVGIALVRSKNSSTLEPGERLFEFRRTVHAVCSACALRGSTRHVHITTGMFGQILKFRLKVDYFYLGLSSNTNTNTFTT